MKSGLQGKDIDSCLLIPRFTWHCTSYSVWVALSWPLFTHSPVNLICVGVTSICLHCLWNIQELLEKANVPFVGTPSKECQRAFDKVHCMFLSRLLLTRYVIILLCNCILGASPLFSTIPSFFWIVGKVSSIICETYLLIMDIVELTITKCSMYIFPKKKCWLVVSISGGTLHPPHCFPQKEKKNVPCIEQVEFMKCYPVSRWKYFYNTIF